MSRLAELDGLLRKHGVSIAPIQAQGVEEVNLPLPDGSDVAFAVTTLNQQKVTGTVWIYNTRTGEGREVDLNSLEREMGKSHRDTDHPEWLGKPLYTLDKAAVPVPVIGTLLCPLNPKHPDFPQYQAVGAQPCRKHTLPHELAVEAHVRIKHPRTYDNMERKRRRDLEEEERAYRRWQMSQGPQAAPQAEPFSDTVQESCGECGLTIEARGRLALVNKMRAHLKNVHEAAVQTA